MFVTKIKSVLAVVLVIAALAGAAGLIDQTQAAEPLGAKGGQPAATKDVPQPKEAKDQTLKLEEPVQSMRWSRDGKVMASLSTRTTEVDGKIVTLSTFRVWDAKTGKLKVNLGELEYPGFGTFDLSRDGKFLAISSRLNIAAGDKVELFNTEKDTSITTIEMEYGRSRPWFALSPDNRTLAVCGFEFKDAKGVGTVRLFDTQKGELKRKLTSHGGQVISVIFSPDGKSLAAGCAAGEITVWDATSGKIKTKLDAAGPIAALAWSDDGKLLASGGIEGGRVWDLATGKSRELKIPLGVGMASAVDGESRINDLVFSPDSRYVAGEGALIKMKKDDPWMHRILVWDTATGELRNEWRGLRGFAFTPDSKRLAVLQDAKTVKLMDIRQEESPKKEAAPRGRHTFADSPPVTAGEPNEGKLKKLLNERLAALRALVKLTTEDYQAGKSSFDRVLQAQRTLLDAQLELCESDKERIAVLEESVALAKQYEKRTVDLYKQASATQSDVLKAQVDRLTAEIALERAKAKTPKEAKDERFVVHAVLESVDAKGAVITAKWVTGNDAGSIFRLFVWTGDLADGRDGPPIIPENRPKLMNVPVRSDAKIVSGKEKLQLPLSDAKIVSGKETKLQLKDLRAGSVVSLQLEPDRVKGFVIVGIGVVGIGIGVAEAKEAVENLRRDAVEKAKPAPAEQLKALLAEHEAARNLKDYMALCEAYEKADDRDRRKTLKDQIYKARETFRQQTEKCAAGCLKLAERHPHDPVALDALIWVVRNTATGARALPENAALVRAHAWALDLLLRDHLRSERLGAFCRLPGMGIMQDPESVKFLQEVLDKSPHRAVQAQALKRLADYKLSYGSAWLAPLRKDPAVAQRFERRWGKELLKKMLEADPDAMRREGERLYERLAKEYHDVPEPQAGTMGKLAALKLAALREPPAVGRPAPEVEGADIEGHKLKLDDHRGKAVLLVFTGDWCAACDAFHPQQRSVAKKFAGRPLALLDVNSDVDLERRKRLNAKDQITWRAVQWTDVDGAPGPIATRWGIHQWPTLFLIDHKGVIRQRYVGSPGEKILAEELDRLIREAEAARKP